MSNNKTAKITHHPQKNAKIYKMSKATKCPKLKNVQNFIMSKIPKCPRLKNIHYVYIWTIFGLVELILCSFEQEIVL